MKTQYSYFKAFKTTIQAKRQDAETIRIIQEERLQRLVKWAREHSPVYREKYQGLPERPSLTELPTVCKKELMARFGDWVTDLDIKEQELKEFIGREDKIGHPFMGRYLVSTTSGSTGVPAVFLYDKNSLNVMDALAVTRSMAYKGVMWKLVKAGGRSAAIYASGGHYLGVAATRRKQYHNPVKGKQFAVYSVLWPIDEIVAKLNAFKPGLLGGYPTALELLIPEVLSGRLTINPVLINTGGEYLSKELSQRLSEAFGCPVQSGYSCTEGGLISFMCSEGHYHVNDDWVILEPVDRDGLPVQAGTLSDKIYITNLANFVQPIIRYEVTDRVRVLKGTCRCGNALTAIEVEGRTDDILEFENGVVRIPPLAVYVILKEIDGVVRFQLIQTSETSVELRLETKVEDNTEERKIIDQNAIKRLTDLFSEKGTHPEIHVSGKKPAPNSSGKFRHIFKA